MSKGLKLSPAKRLQSVVEWRYPRAHRYWDDCGKLITAIEKEFPGLACQALDNDGFRFEGLSSGLTAAKFFWDKATVTQSGQGDAALPNAASRFWTLVRDGLGIAEPTFNGHRTWMCYETGSVKDAVRWLDGFQLWTFLGGASEGQLGVPRMGGSLLRTQLEPAGRRLRLSVDAGTISVKPGSDHHGVIVDADIVIQAPDLVPENATEFVEGNIRFLRENLEPVFLKYRE